MAMAPDEQGIFFILVVSGGPGAGEFIYDASGNLRSANVGQVTTDPIQGITCQQGLSTFNGHGAVINLLSTSVGAFFQYADNGSAVQGALILSTAGAAGTDPVTSTAYPAGQQGINPVFGSFTQLLGSAIVFGVASTFSRNASVSVATGAGASPPYLETDSPEQTTASHMALRLQGASPDGTVPAQALFAIASGGGAITPATKAAVEIQGALALANIAAPAAVAGDAIPFASGSQLRVIDGADGNSYTTERLSKNITSNQIINSVTPAVISAGGVSLSFPLSAGRTYRFHAHLTWVQGGTQSQQFFRLIGTGGLTVTSMLVSVSQRTQSTTGQSVFDQDLTALNANTGNFGASGPAATTTNSSKFDGIIVVNAAGTLNLEALCSIAANTFTITSLSFAEIMPV